MPSLSASDVVSMAEETASDAWDYKGEPAFRRRTGGWTSAAMILVVELNERMTTLGIAVNLVTYLTGTMHLGSAASANVVTNFFGTSFMLCLLGGFIADTFLGRYRTIAIFTAIQATGVIALAISTAAPGLRPPSCPTRPQQPETGCIKASGTQLDVLYLALYLTALGTGGIKSSVSGLGSDQFDDKDPKEKHQMMLFVRWFFFLISLGSLFAVTVLVYIQDHKGRAWGYGTIAAAILVGLGVFISGTRLYRFKQPVASPLTQIAAVLVAAWRNRKLELPSDASLLYDGDGDDDNDGVEDEKKKKAKPKLAHTSQFRFLDKGAIMDKKPLMKQTRWSLSTVTDVEEVKLVIRMLPIWATTILFWTVYAQVNTFSVAQAATMDRRMSSSFQIPAGSLTVFFVASILLTVPLYDRLVVPIASRLTGNPQGLTPLQRIAVGLVLSILAMVAAALTETKRLKAAWAGSLADNTGSTVPMSVFWLVPQFFFVGAGQAFIYIGQLDFFLRECPSGMKTMSTGLFVSTMSLGFFLSSGLVSIVHKQADWLANNLNYGKLYNFYWLLALLCTANFGFYLISARWYVYKEEPCLLDDENIM